jgi:hypothetical protein
VTITPFAVVAFVLLVCGWLATWPAGRARLRRYDLARARRARRSEDRACRRREQESELARSLRFARYDLADQLGGHSLSVVDRDEFARGLGEIDGGGE